MPHNFINQNGYTVCIDCGEAENTHYWNENQTKEIINRIMPMPVAYHKLNTKWKRLLRTNAHLSVSMHHFLYKEILIILNLLPVNAKIKKNLHDYMIKQRFTSYREVCKTFYDLMLIRDLPITSKEFLAILNTGRKQKYKPLTKLYKVENIRKYYWYISKQIKVAQKILNFSNEESLRIYKMVFNYYNLIRFGMIKATNPPYLIQNLIYYTVREIFQPNQHVFNKHNFGLSNLSYTSALVRWLKEIKNKNLDAKFSEKLNIGKRNSKLEAKLTI